LGGTKGHGCVGINGSECFPLSSTTLYLLIVSGLAQYYAALCEWNTGEQKHHDFTANMFLEAYNCHVSTLDKIEGLRNTSYHNMMTEIYQFAA
jgi:hypothetical protein